MQKPQVHANRITRNALLALAVYLAAAALSWRGLGDWDANYYTRGALLWIENGPSLGGNHWELRHPLVLPMALSMELAGRSELAAALPNLVYGALLVLTSVIFASRFLSQQTGLFLGLLVATSPALTLLPLEVEIRGPEILFCVLALWLLLEGIAREGRGAAWFLLGAGLASGLAWMCREVAGYLPPVLFAAGWYLAPQGRRLATSLLSVAGFAATILFELVLYAVVAGDPLFRYKTDLGHGGGVAGTEFAGAITEQNGANGILRDAINPLAEKAADFTTGPYFMAGLLAALALVMLGSNLTRPARNAVVLFVAASVASYAFATLILNLEGPRYFPMMDYCALVLIAAVAGVVAARGHTALVSTAIGSIALASVFVADFQRDYEFDAYRAAAELAMLNDEPIAASVRVRQRAETVLRLKGMDAAAAEAEFASPSEARPGDIGFAPSQPWLAPQRIFGPEWTVIGEAPRPKPSWSHRLVLRAAAFLPVPDVLKRKALPAPATIYQLEGARP